ncbi:MAG TPA: histidine phosphatase family protein [Gemmatimonadales bacterium]|nr:histidine phosphatase family protein [Gemmatimonadales bacterium]
MSTIVLARHGRPVWDFATPIPGHALAEWIRGIDGAPIDRSLRPSPTLLELAHASRCIAASTLRRSLESAEILHPGEPPYVEPLFREVYLPTAIRSGLRLRPRVWTLLARIAWYCGWAPGVESFAEARRRATAAATRLTELARTRGQLLLIGHGQLNGLIGKRLRRAGWRGPWLRPRRYWAFAVYEQS